MRVLVGWHLLSLDAPTVAVLWTWFLARSAGQPVSSLWLLAMFLAVWILYAADRLLDTGASGADLEARHLFHARHRRPFRWALAVISVVLAPLLLTIPAMAMRLYLELGAVLFAWFVLIHVPPSGAGSPPRRLPKELAVGLFFAGAVFIPTVAEQPDLRLRLFPVALLFGFLCSLNCLFIHAWEHPTPQSRHASHRTTRLLLRHLTGLAAAVAALAILLAAAEPKRFFPILLAIGLSAGLLAALDRVRPAQATVLRAAADLVLLTPVLLVPVLLTPVLLAPLSQKPVLLNLLVLKPGSVFLR